MGEIDAFITEAGNDPRRATSVSEASMDDCMSKFTLDVKTRWIPSTMLRTMYSSDKNMYMSRFYLRFSEAPESVASVKLLNEAKSPLKFYKITFDRQKVRKCHFCNLRYFSLGCFCHVNRSAYSRTTATPTSCSD